MFAQNCTTVDGRVTALTTYAPYGTVLTRTGTSRTTYGYTGEQYDAATGLLYLRARYYNSALHTFTGQTSSLSICVLRPLAAFSPA